MVYVALQVLLCRVIKKGGSETQEKPVGTFFYSIYYKDNFYNFRRIFKGPPSLKLIQLLYYITQDIKCIISDNKK